MYASTLIGLCLLYGIGANARSYGRKGGDKSAATPSTPYGPDWQDYFQVSDKLPGVDFSLPTSYAGQVSVNRTGHPDDALFFWAFESTQGSLSAKAGEQSGRPWAVWLNGGPGSSSLNGLLNENGPLQIAPGRTVVSNPYAWSQLADYFWVDQPVGVGYSTAESKGYVADQTQIGEDFVNFLANVVAVFPSLASRPFYLTGESYAGRYIPYIARTLFSMQNPPVKLAKIAIGDPALGSNDEFKTMPVVKLLATHPAIIGYDVDVYNWFEQQTALCGFNINLSYPQDQPLPWIQMTNEGNPERTKKTTEDADISSPHHRRRTLFADVASRYAERFGSTSARRGMKLERRDLSLRANGTIDPWYGCELYDEMVDYAVNYTWPWTDSQEFDNFDAIDAINPDVSTSPYYFLNDKTVRAAIHAPNVDWATSIDYPWGSVAKGGDPSPESMTFLSDLATNASAQGVQFVFFVGNDDAISPAFGTQASIQNTTFGGTRGFTKQPSTPWYADDGSFGGIVHAERNWTYALMYGTGHQVAVNRPAASFAFARDYIFGSNSSLLEAGTAAFAQVDNPTFTQDVIPAAPEVKFGKGSSSAVATAPAATVSAFYQAIGIQTITGTLTYTGTTGTAPAAATHTGKNGAALTRLRWEKVVGAVLVSTLVATWM